MQRNLSHRFLAGTVVGLFMVATMLPAGAAGPKRESSQAQGGAQPDLTTILNQKLIWTGMQGDSARVPLGAGFSNVGTPISVNCGHPCTVVVQTMVQVEETSPYWAICPTIDEIDAVQGCNWQGSTSSGSAVYVTGAGTYFWSLAAGKHVLQPQMYLSVAGALDNWSIVVTKYNTL